MQQAESLYESASPSRSLSHKSRKTTSTPQKITINVQQEERNFKMVPLHMMHLTDSDEDIKLSERFNVDKGKVDQIEQKTVQQTQSIQFDSARGVKRKGPPYYLVKRLKR